MHPKPREVKLAAKRNGILGEIFQSRGSLRFDLARRLNINATMVGNYVTDLLSDGILIETDPNNNFQGRVPLRINPELGCFLGLDFEALCARAVLCDFAGGIIEQQEIFFETGISREDVLEKIVLLAKGLTSRAKTPLVAIGIAAPGLVDCKAGRILHYQLLENFDQVPVRDCFEAHFDVPVFVEHNICAITYAELLRGSGKGSHHFINLAVRSGVALGMVFEGKLYKGKNSFAGEVGCLVFPTEKGPKLAADLISAKGFVDAVMKQMKTGKKSAHYHDLLQEKGELSLQDIVIAADEGDTFFQAQLDQLGSHLGMVAASLANILAPEKIVLTGEVPVCSPRVRRQMEQSFREFTLPQILNNVYMEDGTLGTYAGALGVAWLGFPQVFPVEEQILIQLSKENILKSNLRELPIGGIHRTPAS